MERKLLTQQEWLFVVFSMSGLSIVSSVAPTHLLPFLSQNERLGFLFLFAFLAVVCIAITLLNDLMSE